MNLNLILFCIDHFIIIEHVTDFNINLNFLYISCFIIKLFIFHSVVYLNVLIIIYFIAKYIIIRSIVINFGLILFLNDHFIQLEIRIDSSFCYIHLIAY